MTARSTGLAAAMIPGAEPRRSGRLRRQHSFRFRQTVRDANVEPGHCRGLLNPHMQLFCAVARYSVSPEQGLQSWAMATLMLAARPRPANPDSRSLNVWRAAAFRTCGSIIKTP